jgi:hypothetical protein
VPGPQSSRAAEQRRHVQLPALWAGSKAPESLTVAGPSAADAALSVGNRIGRYFSLVSMLPALLLVVWTYVLIVSGAWSGSPNLDAITARLAHWSLPGLSWAIVATLFVALFLHPLQFATTQALEGYWGTFAPARAAMARRIIHHRRRRAGLDQLEQTHRQAWQDSADEVLLQQHADDVAHGDLSAEMPGPTAWDEATRRRARRLLLDSDAGEPLIAHVATEDAARRSWSRYPDGGRMMATRLGNALRRFEDAGGAQYGLEAIVIAPHLALIVPDRHLLYLQDSRQQLDTTIRLCTVSLLATGIAVVVLLRDGLWLLAALIPYSLAYIAYRGAVASAEEYGIAISSVIDLDRFSLYEQLHVDQPRDTAEEQAANASLIRLLGGDASECLPYRHSTLGNAQTQSRPVRPSRARGMAARPNSSAFRRRNPGPSAG